MAKKLTLDDLKVQSFVTTLNADQADQLIGGTKAQTDCNTCTMTYCGGCTHLSNCCDTGNTEIGCDTTFTDTCDCTYVCTYEMSGCNCTVPPESGC